MVIHLHCDNNSHSLPRTRNRLCKRKAMMGECLSIIAYVQPHPASTNIVRNRVIWRHSFFARKYTIAFHCLPVRSFLVISVGGAHWVKCETLKHMVKFTEKWRRDCLHRKWDLGSCFEPSFFGTFRIPELPEEQLFFVLSVFPLLRLYVGYYR